MAELVASVANENEDRGRVRAVLATLGLCVDPDYGSVIDPEEHRPRMPEQQNVHWLGGRRRR